MAETYVRGIPDAEIEILESNVGSGTEKRVHRARWRGREVAALEIVGASNDAERSVQRAIADDAVLGAHPAFVSIVGESDRYVLNEWAPYGSMSNYDGSPTPYATALASGAVTPRDVASIARQIASAARALLDAGFLHRDLAARNVLVFKLVGDGGGSSSSEVTDDNNNNNGSLVREAADTAKIVVKLTDFGVLCPVQQRDQKNAAYAWPARHAMGTRWMAPEAQPEAGFWFDEKTEVYSFGCFVFEAATGLVPYARTPNSRIGALKARGETLPWAGLGRAADVAAALRRMPPGIKALVELCCEPFAANRPTFAQLDAYLDTLVATDGARITVEEPGACVNNADPSKPWVPTEGLLQRFDAQSVVKDAPVSKFALPNHPATVYSTRLFSDALCDAFVADLVAFHASGRRTARANSNNRHSLLLSELGYTAFLEAFVRDVAAPLWGRLEGHDVELRYRHSHTVQRVADDALDITPLPGSNRGSRHTDASDVTVNVNIGGDWTGGNLNFFDHGATEPSLTLPQSKGQAFLHRGDVLHQAGLLDSGYRFNLVIWCDLVARGDN